MGESVPTCVGIILDGNRRYARERGLPTLEGHRQGLSRLKGITRHAFSRGVGSLVVYAFSTENWNRSPDEVSYLMRLFAHAVAHEARELSEEGVRIRFIGQLERLPAPLRRAALSLERDSARGARGTLFIALSYGGRAEVLAAVNRLLASGAREADEDTLRAYMWSGDLPDPDLVIRTGGEQRLSNFLPWQSVYSELAFTPTYWPEFSDAEFDAVLADYASRERRRGR